MIGVRSCAHREVLRLGDELTLWNSVNHREMSSRIGWIRQMRDHSFRALFPTMMEINGNSCLVDEALWPW